MQENITSCPVRIYTKDTRIITNNSDKILIQTSVFRNKGEANSHYSLIIQQLKASKNSFATLSINDSNFIGSDIGSYENGYAVFSKPYDYQNKSMMLHILVLRRDNIILISQVLDKKQSYSPGISQVTASPEKINYLLNNYYLN